MGFAIPHHGSPTLIRAIPKMGVGCMPGDKPELPDAYSRRLPGPLDLAVPTIYDRVLA